MVAVTFVRDPLAGVLHTRLRTNNSPHFRLYHNFPNPFDTTGTTILFALPRDCFLNLWIDDTGGNLITYDDSEYIRELFSFANIIPWDLTYGMRNVNKDSNQIGKELFISNYSLKEDIATQFDFFSHPKSIANVSQQ